MPDDTAREVRLGGLCAGLAGAIRNAPLIFLAAWALRFALEALPPVLRAQDPLLMGPGHRLLVLTWALQLVVVLVTGLLIRWLLEPKRESLRLDVGVASYLIVVWLSRAPPVLAVLAMNRLHPHTVAEIVARASLVLGSNIGWALILAAFALWPIALMMGDRLGLREAARRMAPVYLAWIAVNIVLMLPGTALEQVWAVTHHLRGLGERLASLAVGSCATTLATFALAYIYARRVRGRDLPVAGGPSAYSQKPA